MHSGCADRGTKKITIYEGVENGGFPQFVGGQRWSGREQTWKRKRDAGIEWKGLGAEGRMGGRAPGRVKRIDAARISIICGCSHCKALPLSLRRAGTDTRKSRRYTSEPRLISFLPSGFEILLNRVT